jgi:DNA replication and repair protein RecF
MNIRSIAVHQFRNFEQAGPISFPSAPLLALLAPNASGKTNFLEAIVMLLRAKSFRSRAQECVEWGKDNFTVQGSVDYGEGAMKLSVQYAAHNQTMHIKENNAPVSPVTFFGHYPLVLFLPEDAFLFSRGPAGRRNFINSSLAGSRPYLGSVVQYHRALRQRNAALKRTQDSSEIEPWTELLATHAEALWAHRKPFVDYLAARIPALYAELFEEELPLTISFIPGASDTETFRELLSQAWPYEKRYRYTLYGPHRDDIEVRVDGRPVLSTLSRGQMRGLVLAAKVAAYGFMKQSLGQEPLLLFDEVMGELDPDRQQRLLSHLPSSQTIITCTSIPQEVASRSDAAVLDVRSFVKTPA